MALPTRVGPLAAMALLEAFLQKQWSLTESEADQLFDEVLGVLERARDERYRFAREKEEPEQP